jgi:hypothetical protein
MPSPEDVVADNAEFLNLVRTAFPVEPLPVQFFGRKGKTRSIAIYARNLETGYPAVRGRKLALWIGEWSGHRPP